MQDSIGLDVVDVDAATVAVAITGKVKWLIAAERLWFEEFTSATPPGEFFEVEMSLKLHDLSIVMPWNAELVTMPSKIAGPPVWPPMSISIETSPGERPSLFDPAQLSLRPVSVPGRMQGLAQRTCVVAPGVM